jgi:transketolase
LFSTGNILPDSLAAADCLADQGISTGLVSLHTVKPLDEPLLLQAFRTCRLVVTLEEHSVLGGLGGAVAEWLSDQYGLRARLLRIGTPDRFLHAGGSEEFARRQFGLDVELLVARILHAWRVATGVTEGGSQVRT